MGRRIIFHIDVNSAYLSWEAVRRLEEGEDGVDLRDIPSAVGGDIKKRHGIILAKSIPAKRYQIKTGEPVVKALKKCPNLLLIPPDHALYEKYSRAFMSILREYSPSVEQYSIDEAFMDMTGMEKLFGAPIEAADRIRERIFRELGFTVNIGISDTKILAKMASDFKKPNLVHTLFPEEIKEKMWCLPVGELFFVGESTEKKLHMLGIHTIGQLALCDREILKTHLKKHGEVIWNFANGIDLSEVEAEPVSCKGYGNSTTVAFDITDEETAGMVLLSLAETIGKRLRRDHARIEMVSVQLRYSDFTQVSHQMLLSGATNITDEIYRTAEKLFQEVWDGMPIRLLGIQTGKIAEGDAGRQMSLFDTTDYERLEKLDRAVDHIRERFGSQAVMRASFIKQEEIEPMSGRLLEKENRKKP